MTSTATKIDQTLTASTEKQTNVITFDSQPELPSAMYKRARGEILSLPSITGKRREITPDVASSIREKMHEKALEVAHELGVEVSFVMTEFNKNHSLQQDVTIKFSGVSSLGHDRFAMNLIRHGRKHKVPPELYGLEFIKGQVEYVITGLDTSGKVPLLRLKDAKGQKLAEAKQVISFLKKQALI